ncbi:MAG TPA: YbhN family protein [Mycobacteriales bacterium]|nr:YbhN family protein [Mycobacteriales bacterium]
MTVRARLWFSWPIRSVLQLVVLGLVVEFIILPQIAGLGPTVRTLLDVDSPWVVLGLGAELASFAAFAAATRMMLAPAHRPPYQRVLRIDLATIGLNHSVPAGGAAGTALGLRLLSEAGVPPDDAAFAKIGQGVGASCLLVVLLVSSVAIAIPLHGSSPLYVSACVVGLAVVVVAALAVTVLHRGRALTTRVLCAVTRRVPKVDDDAGARWAARIGAQFDLMTAHPSRLAVAMAWAAANWLLDAFALWCCLRAYGHSYGYDGLMTSFALAQVAAWVPLTPGGLGVVEGVLIPTLLGFGGTTSTVAVGVITYRLMAYWLTLPLGALAYTSTAGERWWQARRPATPRDDSAGSSPDGTRDDRSGNPAGTG